MTVTAERLDAIYAGSADPWNFANSPYEQAKFRQTRECLARDHYRSALDIGCGNGELARHIAPLCDAYTGLDAVEKAVAAAREVLPQGNFVQGDHPCPLPEGEHDLVVVSEFVYFLGAPAIAQLATEITTRWPRAEVLCVTWLGDTAHELQGEEALQVFLAAAAPRKFETCHGTMHYRIDRSLPEDAI